ncbi:MAG: hypothetical protein ACREOS_11175, partial [Candidatus Dormibacteraceae bacterium]
MNCAVNAIAEAAKADYHRTDGSRWPRDAAEWKGSMLARVTGARPGLPARRAVEKPAPPIETPRPVDLIGPNGLGTIARRLQL